MRNWTESNIVGVALVVAVLAAAMAAGAAMVDSEQHHEIPAGAVACYRADGGFACEDGTWTPDRDRQPMAAAIEEDEPGWDCATMGNRICGPTTGQTLDPCPANMTPGECAAKD